MDELVNPYGNRTPKFNWDKRYQQEILGMLFHDHSFLVQTFGLIKPEYFVNKIHEAISDCLFKHFKKYSVIPEWFVINELLIDREKTEVERFQAQVEFETCVNAFLPGINNRDFNIKRITEFAKEQAFREAVDKAIKLISKRDDESRWDKIEDAMRQAFSVDRTYDLGMDYYDEVEARYARMRQEVDSKEVFVTGLDDLDNLIAHGGLKRGEVGAFIALAGIGKSNFLCKAAATNIKRNKKVLYVSLELNEDQIGSRIDSILCGIDVRSIPDPAEGQIVFPEHIGRKTEEIVKGYLNDNLPENKNLLRIKQFAPGTLSISGLKSYLSQLSFDGFKPDMLIVDYVGELKDIEGIPTHESRQMLVRDLRGIAVQDKLCVFTAMQANRNAKIQENETEKDIDEASIGDSFGQIRPLDALWSINRSQQDIESGVGRIFVIKHRNGISKKRILYKQEGLDATCITAEVYGTMRNIGMNKKAEKVEVPKYNVKNDPAPANHLIN